MTGPRVSRRTLVGEKYGHDADDSDSDEQPPAVEAKNICVFVHHGDSGRVRVADVLEWKPDAGDRKSCTGKHNGEPHLTWVEALPDRKRPRCIGRDRALMDHSNIIGRQSDEIERANIRT